MTSVPSVPYLEAVLLLRSNPEQLWTGSEMARRLYLSEQEAGALLQGAADAGLAVADAAGNPRYRFQPASPELGELVEQLAHHYALDIVTITELIHSRVDRRAKQFADAFRWRKES